MRNSKSTRKTKLNEGQLRRLVRRIIRESYETGPSDRFPRGDMPDDYYSGAFDAFERMIEDWPSWQRYVSELRNNAEDREAGSETNKETDEWAEGFGYANWTADELANLYEELRGIYDQSYGHSGSDW